MKEVKVRAYAKINLTLDILDRLESGYHRIESIMQSISLCDVITLRRRNTSGISLSCNKEGLPEQEDNLAYKAAVLFMRKYNLSGGVEISLSKRIPLKAGLGGGSTDAAATLKGLNDLFGLGLAQDKLMELGQEIGADVPFCIKGGTALAEGIGDALTSIMLDGFKIWYVLVCPDIRIDTKEAYRKYDQLPQVQRRPDSTNMIKALKGRDLEKVASNLCNVFEEVMFKENPLISSIKDSILRSGALGAVMSGSGSSVFGLARNRADAYKIREKLKKCGISSTVVWSV